MRDFTVKSDLSWFANEHHTLDMGVAAKAMHTTFFVGGESYTWADKVYDGWHLAGYVSDDYRPTGNLTITPGLRLEHSEIAQVTDLLPRLAVKYQLTEHSSLNAAWGRYSQYMQLVSFGTNVASLFDSYVPTDPTLKPNRGEQYALSYETQLGDGIKLSSDVYYKRFEQVLEFKKNITDDLNYTPQSRPLADLFNQGNGTAYGWDFFVQGTAGRYAFMTGYGIGNSSRLFNVPEWGGKYPASFDRLHNANLFVSRKFGKHQSLEMRFNYGTGQPITDAVGVYSVGLGLPGDVFVPGQKNNRRLPDYHRLDIAYRLNYQYKHWALSPYLEVINVYSHKNALTFNYDRTKNPITREFDGQIPLLPSIGITAEF